LQINRWKIFCQAFFMKKNLSQFVSPHFRIYFLRPGVNAAAQTAHVLQAVPHEIRRRVQTVLPA
jgi:hypothetical protein